MMIIPFFIERRNLQLNIENYNMNKFNEKIINIADKLDKIGYHNDSDIVFNIGIKLAYTTEGKATSAEMQGITDPDKANFEHEGLFKQIMQQPINLVSRVVQPQVAIDVFLNGGDMEDVVARASMELNIVAERMKMYAEELGVDRLRQLGAPEILNMMNEAKIEAIYFANEEAREHERRHQGGEEMSQEQLSQQIMQNLGSAFPAEMDPQQRQEITNDWTDNYVANLKKYYREDEVRGELGADAPFIIEKAKEQIPQYFNQ